MRDMRKIFGSLREYKWPSILTLLLMVVEAFIETQIPTITANLVNTIENFEGLAGTATPQAMSGVISTGIKLVAMAAVSLLCGGLGGYACSKASAGLALRPSAIIIVSAGIVRDCPPFS